MASSMQQNSQVVRIMLRRIADFFRLMSDNPEQRFYYVLPINQKQPYAYQHSSIRDVATVCDVLSLIQLFEERQFELAEDIRNLFENVCGNTLRAYSSYYEAKGLTFLSTGNVGDLGFFLLALHKCREVCPFQLPKHWEKSQQWVIERLIERQRPNGSIEIFFNKSLVYEQGAEVFYLPEALIGLIAVSNHDPVVDNVVKKSVAYLCQEDYRMREMATDTSTFYFNWQSKLLYHWVSNQTNKPIQLSDHLLNLIDLIKGTRIARISFMSVATVEVACYLEGLVHANQALEMLHSSTEANNIWFSKEINRCLSFLHEIQSSNLQSFHGGFIHSRDDYEARIDVTGHVLNGLHLII